MSISNILIFLSFIFTILWIYSPLIFKYWMSWMFINSHQYYSVFIQILVFQFLHWGLLHFFSNAIFIYIFWNWLEQLIWRKKFFLFFLFSSIFLAISILIFAPASVTIWISWFCMALLTYYILYLKSKDNMEYKWWITALVLNIWLWFLPWISLVWHLFWAIYWVLFFYIAWKKTKN